VVGEVAEAVPDPLHLLDEQVDRLGGPIGTALGGMPGKDLALRRPHSASQPGQLSDLDAVRPAVEAVQRGPGTDQVVGGVDGPQQLLALPGDGDLTTRISRRQPGP
jgi:hypothetical protein